MTLYFTRYNIKTLSKSFMNLRFLRFIDIEKITNVYEANHNEHIRFILNKEIESQIVSAVNSKRYNGVIYSNPNLNRKIIENVTNLVKDSIDDIVFIDKDEKNPDECKNQFSKILYFPTGSRERIIKCSPIDNEMFIWVNKESHNT